MICLLRHGGSSWQDHVDHQAPSFLRLIFEKLLDLLF